MFSKAKVQPRSPIYSVTHEVLIKCCSLCTADASSEYSRGLVGASASVKADPQASSGSRHTLNSMF